MATRSVARCGIYEDRPQICRDYPTAGHYIPPECTYTFPGGDGHREGECACGVGACCSVPREGGEPGGTPLPELAGGQPCKHLVWVQETEKVAALDFIIAEQTKSAGHHLLRVLGHE